MSPEKFVYLEALLFNLGAKDVFKTPIIMKKGRLATKLSVLTSCLKRDELIKQMFRHTTTIGVRIVPIQKIALDRKMVSVNTERGVIRFKISYLENETLTLKPEYEDIAALASKFKMTLMDAEKFAMSAYKKMEEDT